MVTNYKVTIDSGNESKIREWITSGRGLTRWQNLEIASGHAREMFTPSDVGKPAWRYGNPEIVTPDQIQIRCSEKVAEFRGRFKAMYWGPWVGKATEEKAERLCAKHGLAKGSWSWKHDEPGYVMVTIERNTLRPFRIEVTA